MPKPKKAKPEKTKKAKASTKPVEKTEEETDTEGEELDTVVNPKKKSVIEIDEPEVDVIADKIDPDAPIIEEEEETEEIGIDDEEVNPFGDKWEQ